MENKMKTNMSKAVDYSKQTLDPNKDVLMPMSVYTQIIDLVQAVERKHLSIVKTDRYAVYNKVTHAILSKQDEAKLSVEELEAGYYKNIDLEATDKTVRVERDEIGSAAVKVLAEFSGVFKYNIDEGRGVAIPTQKEEVPKKVVKKDVEKVNKKTTK